LVSPVLFVLYIAPALPKNSPPGSTTFTYTYVNNVRILARVITLKLAIKRVNKAILTITNAFRAAGYPINLNKTEALLIKKEASTSLAVLPTALGNLPLKKAIK